MKTLVIVVTIICSCQLLSAQYCGVSDSSQCTSPGLLTSSGFEPSSQIPAVINDSATNIVVEFLGTDTITFNSQYLIADSVSLDSITNLPEGLCWSCNKPSNTFGAHQDGCIKISGVTCSAPGQYRTTAIITAYLSVPAPLRTTAAIVLRVINTGETLPAVDTTGFAEDSSGTVIFYGPNASCWPLGVSALNSFGQVTANAFPNPFSDATNIMLTGINQKFGFELYDVTGRLQQSISSVDSNQFTVRKDHLANGVYLYRIVVANKPAAFGKLVVQ